MSAVTILVTKNLDNALEITGYLWHVSIFTANGNRGLQIEMNCDRHNSGTEN